MWLLHKSHKNNDFWLKFHINIKHEKPREKSKKEKVIIPFLGPVFELSYLFFYSTKKLRPKNFVTIIIKDGSKFMGTIDRGRRLFLEKKNRGKIF